MTCWWYLAAAGAFLTLVSCVVAVFTGRVIRRSYPPDYPTSEERWAGEPPT